MSDKLGQVILTPGFETGSDYCGGCIMLNGYNIGRTDMHPTWYCPFGILGTQNSYKGLKRQTECKDSEVEP